jgi:hypothetical protein
MERLRFGGVMAVDINDHIFPGDEVKVTINGDDYE